jgi:HTH-type transcriptional regulator, competence development regulator
MALTPFGKALRKLRIDRDMLLKDLADKMSVTPAFLSAIEAGRKAIPHGMTDRVASLMNLDSTDYQQLKQAADLSVASVQIPLSSASSLFDRSLATQLARNFDELDESQKTAIKQIMDRRKT